MWSAKYQPFYSAFHCVNKTASCFSYLWLPTFSMFSQECDDVSESFPNPKLEENSSFDSEDSDEDDLDDVCDECGVTGRSCEHMSADIMEESTTSLLTASTSTSGDQRERRKYHLPLPSMYTWWLTKLHASTHSLQWRHNEPDGVSNYQPHDCLLNRLFRCWSKKTSKLSRTKGQ